MRIELLTVGLIAACGGGGGSGADAPSAPGGTLQGTNAFTVTSAVLLTSPVGCSSGMLPSGALDGISVILGDADLVPFVCGSNTGSIPHVLSMSLASAGYLTADPSTANDPLLTGVAEPIYNENVTDEDVCGNVPSDTGHPVSIAMTEACPSATNCTTGYWATTGTIAVDVAVRDPRRRLAVADARRQHRHVVRRHADGHVQRIVLSLSWQCYGRAMATKSPLDQLLADSGLGDKATKVDANMVRLQWGSAFVLVGVSGSRDRRDRAAVPAAARGQGARVLSQAARAQRVHGWRSPRSRFRPTAGSCSTPGARSKAWTRTSSPRWSRRRSVRGRVRRQADRRVLLAALDPAVARRRVVGRRCRMVGVEIDVVIGQQLLRAGLLRRIERRERAAPHPAAALPNRSAALLAVTNFKMPWTISGRETCWWSPSWTD